MINTGAVDFEFIFKVSDTYTAYPLTIYDKTDFNGVEVGFTAANFLGTVKGYMPDGSVFMTVATPDITGATVSKGMALAMDADGINFIPGRYKFEYITTLTTTQGVINHTVTKYADYQYVRPAFSIGMSADVNSSTLTSADITQYDSRSVSYVASQTLKWPSDLNPTVADVLGATSSLTIGPNIYSGSYTSIFTTTSQYSFGGGFIVEDVKTFSDSTIVDSNSLVCKVRCLLDDYRKQIKDIIAAGGDATQLTIATNYILASLRVYEAFIACDDRAGAIKIKDDLLEFIETCDCDCDDCDSPDETGPVEILPISSITQVVNGDSAEILFGTGVPSGVLGDDLDTYINVTNGDMYKKISGAWVMQLTLTGATGAAGTNGVGATEYFTYILYCEGFDISGDPINAVLNPTASSLYLAKLETVTEIVTLNATAIALFNGKWIKYKAEVMSVTPIGAYVGANPTITNDFCTYTDTGSLIVVNFRMFIETSAALSFFTLPLAFAYNPASLQSVWLRDHTNGISIRVRADVSPNIEFYAYGTSFLANTQYEIEGQFILVK
jgi:hypothetical protein